ncbi:MAG: Rpn family recombination-promoting nuclease/putative transposase [Saccharospirillum sp.]|nr:Rpn family recombination-promoting nuclease/putative transposase [Saccharospirillum sp.]
MQQELLDPKNDYVFKRLFGQAPDLLISLINAIRDPEPDITWLEVLNPTITAEEINGKTIVLDLLAEDADGQRYNIEMQVARYKAWSARSLYYLSRMLSNQIKSGQDYPKLKAAIGIHLLDFDLFHQPDQQDRASWCFEMRDSERPDIRLGRELQLNVLELRKADRLGIYSKELTAWIRFIEHWQDEADLQTLNYEPVTKAMGKLREISADEKERWAAFSRERALSDYNTLMLEAREEGLEQGIEQGIEQGMHEGVEAMLRKQIVLKFGDIPDWADNQMASANDAQLEEWVTRILSVSSLDELLGKDQ